MDSEGMCFCLFNVKVQGSEIMYLPVEELHLRAKSLVAKFKQGGGLSYIEEAINLDREALGLCPPIYPARRISLTQLALHLGNRYDQLGGTFAHKDSMVGRHP